MARQDTLDRRLPKWKYENLCNLDDADKVLDLKDRIRRTRELTKRFKRRRADMLVLVSLNKGAKRKECEGWVGVIDEDIERNQRTLANLLGLLAKLEGKEASIEEKPSVGTCRTAEKPKKQYKTLSKQETTHTIRFVSAAQIQIVKSIAGMGQKV